MKRTGPLVVVVAACRSRERKRAGLWLLDECIWPPEGFARLPVTQDLISANFRSLLGNANGSICTCEPIAFPLWGGQLSLAAQRRLALAAPTGKEGQRRKEGRKEGRKEAKEGERERRSEGLN